MQQPTMAALLNEGPVPSLLWIEVASTLQIPSFLIVGLPAPEVAEARERVRSAILSSNLEFPRRRVVLNLSPASVRKQGTGLDLAMALAVLSANSEVPLRKGRHAAWGELGLDGRVKPAGQLLRALSAAWEQGISRVFLSQDELEPALARLQLLATGRSYQNPAPRLVPVQSLKQAWEELLCDEEPAPPKSTLPPPDFEHPTTSPSHLLPLGPTLSRIIGIASAGEHHLLLLGPRGAGKTRALDWLEFLQPSPSSSLRVTQTLIHELRSRYALAQSRTVRRVSPNARPSALLGSFQGSTGFLPGEYSLAHGGLLIADEFPEWPRDCRESLREPLEDGKVTLNRVAGSLQAPASFQFAATGNFCACGGWPRDILTPTQSGELGDSSTSCHCRPAERQRYLNALSGPVLDRVDIGIRLAPPRCRERNSITPDRLAEMTSFARARAVAAWGTPPGRLSASEAEQLLAREPEWSRWIEATQPSSLRSRHKILRIGLTLAAWTGGSPTASHFREASFLRPEAMGLSEN